MRWSRVDFEREEIVVCENVGTLSVSLLRTGDLQHSAYVSIQVREISAKVGDDFVPNSVKQVQFDPGILTLKNKYPSIPSVHYFHLIENNCILCFASVSLKIRTLFPLLCFRFTEKHYTFFL